MLKVDINELDNYKNLGKAMLLSNGVFNIIVTLDVGPRIMNFALCGGENILGEDIPEQEIVGDQKWNIYGGHRVWHSPEVFPRTYIPDNDPIDKYELVHDGIILYQKEEDWVHMQKVIEVHLLDDRVKVINHIVNKGAWPIETSVWSITICSAGGKEVIPIVQRKANKTFLPNKMYALWHYSRFDDPRVHLGQKYIILDIDPENKEEFKIGYPNEYGWGAYFNKELCFIKKYSHIQGSKYPDYGCSWETYTTFWGVELETLSPFTILEPQEKLTHINEWFLFDKVKAPGNDENEIEEILKPLVEKAGIILPLVQE